MYVSNSYANAEVTVTIFTGQVRAFGHAQHRHHRFKTPKGLFIKETDKVRWRFIWFLMRT